MQLAGTVSGLTAAGTGGLSKPVSLQIAQNGESRTDWRLEAKTVGTAITTTGGVAAADATSFFVNAGQKAAVAVVTSGADTWVFVDANKDGNYDAATDMAIKLVAVTSTDVTSTDFIFA